MDEADIEYLNRYVETSKLIPEIEVWFVSVKNEWFRVHKIGRHLEEPGPVAHLSHGQYVALHNCSNPDQFRIIVSVSHWPSKRGM